MPLSPSLETITRAITKNTVTTQELRPYLAPKCLILRLYQPHSIANLDHARWLEVLLPAFIIAPQPPGLDAFTIWQFTIKLDYTGMIAFKH